MEVVVNFELIFFIKQTSTQKSLKIFIIQRRLAKMGIPLKEETIAMPKSTVKYCYENNYKIYH